jgi:diketogulonate reductase-like aldo/keto reductase
MNRFSRREWVKFMGCAGVSALLSSLLSSAGASFNSSAMLQRIIPSSGERLPVVGLGTWLQFDVGSSASEREPLLEVLRQMAAKGGKVIDSSPMYGKAEEVIGALTTATGKPDQFFYATKVWTSGEQNGIVQMEASLKKMKRNKMDLLQVHNLLDWQTHLRTLNRWKKEGRVRYTGITHYTVSAHDELEGIVRSRAVDFVQFNYSIRVRSAEQRLLKACADSGVAVIINQPFDSGDLFQLVKGRALPPWAAEYNIQSWAQYFLKYILSHPAVTCVIPGTSNPRHVVDNMGAGYGRLPDERERKRMIEFLEKE